MPSITSSVGEGKSANKSHDVALVQAMLRVIKKGGKAYLGGNYDGVYGKLTKAAIDKFQTDYKLIKKAGTDKSGKLMPNGETIKKLNALLPATHKPMRIIPGTKTVYIEDTSANAALSKQAVAKYPSLEANFQKKVGDLVQEMFKQHKIVLWVTPTGYRRTFAEQSTQVNTNAGPGESNHNFGRAVDIGFKNLKWLRGNGTWVTDAYWLNQLEKTSVAKATSFWDARDAIALKSPISMYRLKFERIHLQSYNQAAASSSRSLASLLTTVGAMKWAARYKCDLGGGKQLFHVGNAKQIWAGNATVSKADIATAKGIKVAKVTAKDVADMKKALKADFEAADAQWKQWKPVP